MKGVVGGVLVALAWWTPLVAREQSDSLERIGLALQHPLPSVRGLGPVDSGAPKTFGIFTLLEPTGPGEVIRVSVPVGEFVSRAVKGVAAANHRRQEAAARRKVEAELKRFEEQQASRARTTRP